MSEEVEKNGKKKMIGIAVVLLMAVSSMVYAETQKEKECPCKMEVNNGCIPDEPQMSREPIEPRDCGTRTYYVTECVRAYEDNVYIRHVWSNLCDCWCWYKDYHCVKEYGKYKVVYDSCFGVIRSKTLVGDTWEERTRKVCTVGGCGCCYSPDDLWQCSCNC